MNLFGFEIKFNGKQNPNVKRDECHAAQDSIKELLNQRFDDFSTRLDDFKDFILNNERHQ